MHPGHSESTSGPQPVKPQCLDGFILQTAGNGHMGDVQHGSTTFGGSFNIENSLDFLLPCDMLNEVGGSSPYNGGNETIFSGLLQSLDTSLVSGQESALTRAFSFLAKDINSVQGPKISGAKVEVHDPSPGETEGMVLISETPDQTLVAQSLFQAVIQANQLSTSMFNYLSRLRKNYLLHGYCSSL
ncbi:hypothetical protein GQ457_02G008910 [Hibiscus cannabinus]